MDNETFVNQLTQWRHYLHEHAESAFEEVETSEFVAQTLEKMGYEVHRNIGVTGVVASLTVGDGKEVIGLRADMDAIKMRECSDVPYTSKNEDRMHACGHDGHTTTLLGAAKLLMERKNFNGTVRFIFQPAEEPGQGAIAMINDGLFERFPVDEIYGLHNMPQLKKNTFHTCNGGMMASEDNFVITIKGKGCHCRQLLPETSIHRCRRLSLVRRYTLMEYAMPFLPRWKLKVIPEVLNRRYKNLLRHE